MRIVHIAPFYHPVIGGVEEVVKRIAEYTASKGYDVYVVTYNRTRAGNVENLPIEEVINNVHVIRLKPIFYWSHGTFSSKLPETLKKLKPDIVHVHAWRHPHVFQAIRLKEQLKFKMILQGHAPFYNLRQLGLEIWIYHKLIDMFMKNVINKYDYIIAITPLEKDILVRKLNIASDKIVIIPNGIDDSLLDISRNACGIDNKDIVLFIGRISKEKNINLLINAMRFVVKELNNVELILAGPDEGFLRKYLKKNKDKHIKYLGTISESAKYRLYSLCRVYANPATYEGFGLTLLEAQAFGKPCVITGWGGQLYACPPGFSGVYAEPDPKKFGNAIKRLLSDEILYRRLSENAIKWALMHRWSRILPLYKRLYEELLDY
jgi:glycosyltransferase involved in cell wall biosynthesis